MTKTFKLESLDCPVCAEKVERAVKSVRGVTSASVNFISEKLTVEYVGDSADKIFEIIKTAVKKANPDVVIKNA